MLDVDHGTYPYVTSSNTTGGGASTGTGLGPRCFDYVLGIVKAYATRVGAGPFPTELFDAIGKHLSDVGHEFGSVTGRARRCGWFDAVALRRSVIHSSVSGLCVTKLDVLDGLETVRLCTGYRLRGELLSEPPMLVEDFASVEPVYEELPGWSESTVGLTQVRPAAGHCALVPGAPAGSRRRAGGYRVHRAGSRTDHRAATSLRLIETHCGSGAHSRVR